jgi:antitoxin ParD1/3/4
MPIQHWDLTMPTRNIVLTDHQENLLERLVSSGRYQNASEVLREGLRLVERQETEDKARLKVLRDAAHVGIEDVKAGRVHDFTSTRELRAHLNSLAQQALARKRAR